MSRRTPLIVLYDACVLYPASLRDLLMRLAAEEVCQARWLEEILEEVFRNLRTDRPDLDPVTSPTKPYVRSSSRH